MLQTLYLMQQAPDTSGTVPFSIGLVIICLLLLILLWLPDIIKQDLSCKIRTNFKMRLYRNYSYLSSLTLRSLRSLWLKPSETTVNDN